MPFIRRPYEGIIAYIQLHIKEGIRQHKVTDACFFQQFLRCLLSGDSNTISLTLIHLCPQGLVFFNYAVTMLLW